MNSLAGELKKSKLKAKMLLQVHDELLLEVPKGEVKDVAKLVRKHMEGVGDQKGFPKIKVPLTVEMGEGQNWLELK